MSNSNFSSEEEFLANYDIHKYDTPLTTVDLVIFTVIDGELKVLVVKRSEYPEKGKWSLPGGFIQTGTDESIEAAAIRKLKEKTGVISPYIEQLQTIGNKDRDPRGWSLTVVYFALVAHDAVNPAAGKSVSETRWLTVNGDNSITQLAFDHDQILSLAYSRLQSKVEYTALPLHLLPDEFTLTEFQQIFEVILDRAVDKSAFRRRIREADIVEEIPGKMRHGSNRPAKLYKAKSMDSLHYFSRNLER